MERRSNIMAASYSYSVILEPQEGGGFTVLVPALPEVVTEGETEQEALANVEEAIRPRISAGTGVDASVRCPSRNSSRNGGCLSMGGGRLPVVNGKRVVQAHSSSIGLSRVITFLF